MVWKWAVSGALAVLIAGALVACGSGGGAPGGNSGLEAALSRVADTSANRAYITYDDTEALVKVAGKTPSAKGYAPLIGSGTTGLALSSPEVQSLAGINLFDEQYSMAAGLEPATVGLVAGGQNAATVAQKLTAQGWKRQGQRLVMLDQFNQLDEDTEGLLAQVQPNGPDVVYGSAKANLSQAGAPSGETLEQDPTISALANCLGNVVSAEISNVYPPSTLKPAEVALGVTAPASNAAVAHVVACVAWSSSALASRYTSALHQALSSGIMARSTKRWSTVLRDASVTNIGGSQNVVEWQAQTPDGVQTVFDMFSSADLPGLPTSI